MHVHHIFEGDPIYYTINSTNMCPLSTSTISLVTTNFLSYNNTLSHFSPLFMSLCFQSTRIGLNLNQRCTSYSYNKKLKHEICLRRETYPQLTSPQAQHEYAKGIFCHTHMNPPFLTPRTVRMSLISCTIVYKGPISRRIGR